MAESKCHDLNAIGIAFLHGFEYNTGRIGPTGNRKFINDIVLSDFQLLGGGIPGNNQYRKIILKYQSYILTYCYVRKRFFKG